MEHLVLVGAGPHGLAVLVALAERGRWPSLVTVVDPHAGWARAWDDKLARLDLDRLRSPQVHHPGVRPMQLRDMVEALPAEEQLALRRPETERAPTPAGMRRFVDGLAAELGPVEWITGRATSVTPRADGVEVTVALGDDRQARADLRGDGEMRVSVGRVGGAADSRLVLDADAVVLAHNPSFPRIPDWAAPLVAGGLAEHASTVDVRTADVAGRDVLIVGGGLTAACLALETARRGGRATVVTRRALRARPYDVDASWLGPRRLTEYLAAPVDERRRLIDVARDGGTIPPRTLDELRARAADPAGGVTLREAVDVEAEVRAALAAPTPPVLWLATGFEQAVRRDPLVGPLVDGLDLTLHGGLPEVDEHLRLGGAPIYVTGPYAALAVGPACRNLAGARPAAQRIADGLCAEPVTT